MERFFNNRNVLGVLFMLPAAVLLLAARMNGYTGEHAPLFASVIEFIHTATLVHDDIIDKSDMRRGRQAVHSGRPRDHAEEQRPVLGLAGLRIEAPDLLR